MALNAWSDAPDYALLNAIYALPIPFEPDWSRAELVLATRAMLHHLADELGGLAQPPWPTPRSSSGSITSLPAPGGGPDGFIPRLFADRWAEISTNGELLPADTALADELSAICDSRPAPQEKEKPHHSRDDTQGTASHARSHGGLGPGRAQRIQDGAEPALALFRQMRGDVLPIALGNFCERVALVALGLESVAPFLARCFP